MYNNIAFCFGKLDIMVPSVSLDFRLSFKNHLK